MTVSRTSFSRTRRAPSCSFESPSRQPAKTKSKMPLMASSRTNGADDDKAQPAQASVRPDDLDRGWSLSPKAEEPKDESTQAEPPKPETPAEPPEPVATSEPKVPAEEPPP